jgi:hypothetical protein
VRAGEDTTVGFLDGMMLRMTRPGTSRMQAAAYSGYLKGHGGKVLAAVAPDGLTLFAFSGSVRSPDQVVAVQRDIDGMMKAASASADPSALFSVYGDNIFRATGGVKRAHCVDKRFTPQFRLTYPALTARMREQDDAMATARASVEHMFGGIKNTFRLLGRREKLQLLQPNKVTQKLLLLVFFLSDAKACLMGNQTSERFNVPPPLLSEYLHDLKTFVTQNF